MNMFVQAAQDLHRLGPKYVLIKGGHLIATPTSDPSHPSSDPPATPTSVNGTSATASSAAHHSQQESAPHESAASSAESVHAAGGSASEATAEGDSATADVQQGEQSEPHSSKGEEAEQDTGQHNGKLCHDTHHPRQYFLLHDSYVLAAALTSICYSSKQQSNVVWPRDCCYLV